MMERIRMMCQRNKEEEMRVSRDRERETERERESSCRGRKKASEVAEKERQMRDACC